MVLQTHLFRGLPFDGGLVGGPTDDYSGLLYGYILLSGWFSVDSIHYFNDCLKEIEFQLEVNNSNSINYPTRPQAYGNTEDKSSRQHPPSPPYQQIKGTASATQVGYDNNAAPPLQFGCHKELSVPPPPLGDSKHVIKACRGTHIK
ncbi:hypothetical protein CDAR_120301 [Caerostris darwini]|uniref:Uncharacterized protein n=1 Tax=Caerostris darwini TaxID=1538125 RepID=A0AAV4TDX2_9ARAC|nr:hypothetical protein CDAR_120301 [Caerostris darwini]